MMPLFTNGQRVVCVDSSGLDKEFRLVEGARYHICCPDYKHPDAKDKLVLVHLLGVNALYDQMRFMSRSEEFQMELEIQDALKHHLKQK